MRSRPLERSGQHRSLSIPVCGRPRIEKTERPEKPLSDRLDGVDERIALAERQKRILMVGLCFRFHKGLLRVKELIDSGTIRRLVSVRALMGAYLPACRPGVGLYHPTGESGDAGLCSRDGFGAMDGRCTSPSGLWIHQQVERSRDARR